MTKREFLKKLKATPRNWKLSGYSYPTIRMMLETGRKVCPITSLSPEYPVSEFFRAAEELTLPRNLAEKIAMAADGDYPNHKLRLQLLKACDLLGQAKLGWFDRLIAVFV